MLRPFAVKTYAIKDEQGQLFAVEVDMVYCGLLNLMAVVGSTEEVSDVEIGSARVGGSDVRATFRYRGDNFAVTEPFGDNSRYWIGSVESGTYRDITAIDHRLKVFKPSVLRRIVGGLITLDFAALRGR